MEQPFQRSSALYPCVSPIFPGSRKAVDRRIFLKSCNHFPPPLKSLISEGAFHISAAKAPARHPQPSFVQKPLLFKLFAFFPLCWFAALRRGGQLCGSPTFLTRAAYREVHVFPQPTLPGATPAPAFAADLLPRSPPASSPPLSFGSALQSKTSLSIVWGPMLVGGHLLRSRDARRSIFAVSFCVKVFSTLAQYAIIAAASLSRRGAPGLTRAGAGPCLHARFLLPAEKHRPEASHDPYCSAHKGRPKSGRGVPLLLITAQP